MINLGEPKILKMNLRFAVAFILIFQFVFSQQKPSLIPYPQNIEIKNDFFQIPKTVSILLNFTQEKNREILNLMK